MSLTIPNVFTAGTKARASEVNGNFAAVQSKFTEGSGGIADGDIASAAAIKASKLSSTPGNRVTATQLEDDAVDVRVLKDDPSSGSPNAAVGLAAQIKDGIITGVKLVDATVNRAKLNMLSTTLNVPTTPGSGESYKDTLLLRSAVTPIDFQTEFAGSGGGVGGPWGFRFHVDTATEKIYLVCTNFGAFVGGGFNGRMWYITN